MRHRAIALFCALPLLAGSIFPVDAAAKGLGFLHGKELEAMCFSPDPGRQAMCAGYVAAIGDAMDGGAEIDNFSACFTVGASVDNLTEAMRRWFKSNKGGRYARASQLVAGALAEAYPCQKSGKGKVAR